MISVAAFVFSVQGDNTDFSNTERSSGLYNIFIIYSKFSVYRMKQPLKILKHAVTIYSTNVYQMAYQRPGSRLGAAVTQ